MKRSFRMWNLIGTIAAIAAGGYIVFAIMLYIMQSRFIYIPTAKIEADPGKIGLEFENVDFAASDSVTLNGWFIPAENERAVLLFCHGNAGNISHRLESIQLFNRLGLSVFIFDYRGYGRSSGKPTEEGTHLDASAAWQWLVREKQYAPDKIIIFGRSLGGAAAARLASETNPRALIVESAFTSIEDMASKLYPYMPVRLLGRFHYGTIDYIRGVKCPVLIIHSTDDELVPYSHGRLLYEAAGQPKEFLEISGDHNRAIIDIPDKYAQGLDSFLTRYINN